MKEFCAECLTSLPCYVLPSWKTANTPLAFPNPVLNVFQFKPEIYAMKKVGEEKPTFIPQTV